MLLHHAVIVEFASYVVVLTWEHQILNLQIGLCLSYCWFRLLCRCNTVSISHFIMPVQPSCKKSLGAKNKRANDHGIYIIGINSLFGTRSITRNTLWREEVKVRIMCPCSPEKYNNSILARTALEHEKMVIINNSFPWGRDTKNRSTAKNASPRCKRNQKGPCLETQRNRHETMNTVHSTHPQSHSQQSPSRS